jgi:hypothetical protein
MFDRAVERDLVRDRHLLQEILGLAALLCWED